MSDRIIKSMTSDGKDYVPFTVTDAIGHDEAKVSLTKMIEVYNLESCYKSGAIKLKNAIDLMSGKLTAQQKHIGVRIEFIDIDDGIFKSYEYFDSKLDFTNILGWRRVDGGLTRDIEASVFPLSLKYSVDIKKVLPVNQNAAPTFSWSVYRKNKDVTSDAVKYFNGQETSNLVQVVTIDADDVKTRVSKEYTFKAIYEGLSISETITLYFVDYSYYGVVPSDWIPNSTDIIVGSKNVKNVKSLTATYNLNYQKSFYAYPTYFGTLTSIKDQNNFEYIASYDKTTISVGGVDYYVYTLVNPTTITGMKQIFS